MSTGLERVIAAVANDLTAQEWADAIWLASMHSAPASPASPTREPSGPASPHLTPSSGTGRISRVDHQRRAPPGPQPPDDERAATIHLPAEHFPSGESGHAPTTPGPHTWLPAFAAVGDTLELFRALRPLRVRRPSRRRYAVDESATAAAIADSALWTPQLKPRLEYRFDLTLVVDVSGSMTVWRRTVEELEVLLERLGAFRDIRRWNLDGDSADRPIRMHMQSSDRTATETELIDPRGQQLVIVVSDCVGAAWRSGAVSLAMDGWTRQVPTLVLQMLPQRMWRHCGVSVRSARLPARSAAGGSVATSRLGEPFPRRWGSSVPVVELDPRWLQPWAALTVGKAACIDTMVTFTRMPTSVRPAQTAGPEIDPPLATDLVAQFRSVASPTAFQLAAYLAATPLSLPVIRLVQTAMLPESRPAHLAEFFLSGLIEPLGEPAHLLFEFRPGVREVLLTRLRRSEAVFILHRVAEHAHFHYGLPRDFRAVLAYENSAPHVGPDTALSLPFGRVLRQVLAGLGGRYARFAADIPVARPVKDGIADRPSRSDIESAPHSLPSVHPARGAPHRIRGGALSTLSPTDGGAEARPPVIFDGVPTRNPNFTGREELLEQLHNRLASSLTTALLPQALHGLGGVGKTQLAVEFCHRFAASYDLICWISAEQSALARGTVAALAPRLNLPRMDDQSQAVNAVRDALRRGEPYARWLLVFDNADSPHDLSHLMPEIQGPGQILITSRNQEWADRAKILEVDVFTREESIRLLERRNPGIDRQDADRLAEKLGDLPLALEQAAAWRAETGMPVDEYLTLVDERLDELFSATMPSTYPRSVAATWRIAFERLTVESPEALQLLELCAFFGSEPISMQLMPLGRFASIPVELRRTVADPIALGRAIRHLNRYALARVDHPTNSVQVHRLVQAVLRERLSDVDAQQYRHGVQEILSANNPGDPDDQGNWERYSKLAPHVEPSDAVNGATDEVRRMVLDQIRYFQVRGDYTSSRDLARDAFDNWRERLGADHEQTLVCGRLLAINLRWLGDADKAREINEETYNRQLAMFTEEHEHTLVTASSLGADLRAAGEFEAAYALGRRTLEGHLRVFREDHSNTLQAANNLAVDHRLAGRFVEAEDLDRDTLARRRRVLGEDHPETLMSFMNLGRDLYGRGDYRGALEMLQRAIVGYERNFGLDHPPLLLTNRLYSSTLRKLGEFQASYEHARTNVQHYVDRLGEDHLDALAARMNLVNSTRAINQSQHAAETGLVLLERYRDISGDTHPFTLACEANLAVALRETGDHAAARRLDEHATETFTETLGREHPSSLSAGNNLATDLYLAGEYDEAAHLSERTLTRSREVRGWDDPYTLGSAANHAINLRAIGDTDGARALESDTWWRYRQVLGERHPETLAAMAGSRIEAEIDTPPT